MRRKTLLQHSETFQASIDSFKAQILQLEGWSTDLYKKSFRLAVKESILQRGWQNTKDLIILADYEHWMLEAEKVYNKFLKITA